MAADDLTQNDVYALVAYGVKLVNPEHSDFLADIGFDKTFKMSKVLLRNPLAQIDSFIQREDQHIYRRSLPKINPVSDEVGCLCEMSKDEYAEIIHSNRESYSARLKDFSDKLGIGAVEDRKNMKLFHNVRRTEHFCDDESEKRTFFDYNVNLFELDRQSLYHNLKEMLQFDEETFDFYSRPFDSFVDAQVGMFNGMLK